MALGSNVSVNTISARARPAARFCNILAPSNGATVSGVVTITVEATDTPTITIDGVEAGTGFTYDWDTTAVADGSHTIEANYKNANDAVTVTVDNGGSPPPPPPPPPGGDGVVRKWALVIGIEDYEGTANDLTYCVDDAVDWKNYLEDEGYTVNMLTDHQATWDNIYAAFEELGQNEDADDLVAITYSGHGYYYRTTRESCIVSWGNYLLPSSEFKSITDTYDSQQVFMFLDCCNIGTFKDLCRTGWVAGIGSTTRTYTYDGTAAMQNGIYTYYAMEAIYVMGYTTAEDICDYAV
jgi:predicted secreted protein